MATIADVQNRGLGYRVIVDVGTANAVLEGLARRGFTWWAEVTSGVTAAAKAALDARGIPYYVPVTAPVAPATRASLEAQGLRYAVKVDPAATSASLAALAAQGVPYFVAIDTSGNVVLPITNYLYPSNNLNGGNWDTLNGGTAGSVSTTNPATGETVAWNVTAGSGFGGRQIGVPLVAGTYTASAYLKTSSGTLPIVFAMGFPGNMTHAPAVTATTTLTRFSKTFTVTAGTPDFFIYVNAGAGTVQVDSVQINVGSSALPYVATTTAPA